MYKMQNNVYIKYRLNVVYVVLRYVLYVVDTSKVLHYALLQSKTPKCSIYSKKEEIIEANPHINQARIIFV